MNNWKKFDQILSIFLEEVIPQSLKNATFGKSRFKINDSVKHDLRNLRFNPQYQGRRAPLPRHGYVPGSIVTPYEKEFIPKTVTKRSYAVSALEKHVGGNLSGCIYLRKKAYFKKSLIWRVPYNILIQNMQKKKRFFQTAKVDEPLKVFRRWKINLRASHCSELYHQNYFDMDCKILRQYSLIIVPSIETKTKKSLFRKFWIRRPP